MESELFTADCKLRQIIFFSSKIIYIVCLTMLNFINWIHSAGWIIKSLGTCAVYEISHNLSHYGSLSHFCSVSMASCMICPLGASMVHLVLIRPAGTWQIN